MSKTKKLLSLMESSEYPDSAGSFWMCFRGDICWGEWDTDNVDTLDCEGDIEGEKQ